MAWCRIGDKPLPEPVLTYYQLDFRKILTKTTNFSFKIMHLKMLPANISLSLFDTTRPEHNVQVSLCQIMTGASVCLHVKKMLIKYRKLVISIWHFCPSSSCWFIRGWLSHWGSDKIAASSQTTLSNTFPWMKLSEFRLKFHWSLFLRAQLTIFQHWFW